MPEDVLTLYEELEKEALSKSAKGEKANEIRTFIRDFVGKAKKPKLSMSAMYKLVKKAHPTMKIDRSYFTTIITSTWETEKDANGAVWINVTKEKVKAEKAA